MKHLIVCKSTNGDLHDVVYDNLSNEISVDGVVIDVPDIFGVVPNKNWNTVNDFTSFSPESPAIKSRSVKTLKIQLGLKCNYSCSYCKQSSHISDDIVSSIEDARTFVERVSKSIDAPNSVELWGGEPFAYWKHMQVIVRDLRDVYPEVDIGIVTNGSLLDEEKLKWVTDNDISLTISHDGPGQYLRGPDPIENLAIKAIWQKFVDTRSGSFCFSSVLTSNNNDVAEIASWFTKIFGDGVVVNFEGIVNVDGSNPESFNKDQFDNLKRSIYSSIADGSVVKTPSISSKLFDFYSALMTKRPAQKLGQKCGMDSSTALAVDLSGNVMTCHNTGAKGKHKIGHISSINDVRLNTSWHWSSRKNCTDCPVLQICKGSCMYLDGKDFNETCINEYNYALPILAGAISIATKMVIESMPSYDAIPGVVKKIIPIINEASCGSDTSKHHF